jgi:hypothetical protein
VWLLLLPWQRILMLCILAEVLAEWTSKQPMG